MKKSTIRKAVLIVVWAVCSLNIFFFSDIVINHWLGNTQSALSGATTRSVQCYISFIMIAICVAIIAMYTIVLREARKDVLIIFKDKENA